MASQTFNSSGTWVVPAHVAAVQIECYGGGGGGGAGSNSDSTGNGGGGPGGGYAKTNALAVSPGDTLTVTVGAGGAAGDWGISSPQGGNGGQTWVSKTGSTPTSTANGCLANGGGQGSGGYIQPGAATPGASTSGEIGDTVAAGGTGLAGPSVDTGVGGAGGGPAGGAGGSYGGNPHAGAGTAPGGGGGGGQTGTGYTGGTGAAGRIIFTWTPSGSGAALTPTSATSAPSYAGAYTWSNPTNATGTSGYASAYLGQTGTATQYLVASNFGFSIPAKATVTSIVGTADTYLDMTPSGLVSAMIGLFTDAGASLSGNGIPSTRPDGGGQEIWGNTVVLTRSFTWSQAQAPTVSQINGSGFGFAFTINLGSGPGPTMYVNNLTLAVYFTLPTGITIRVGRAVIAASAR